jgi:FAD/FMN-containing dehydrogenase
MGFCDRVEHDARCAATSAEAKKPGPIRMYKATASNTFRPHQIKSRESSQSRLDLSGFCHVLEVNVDELWCDIEAMATFETFVSAALSKGVAPLVVPELRTITVGGAIVGLGIESGSFRHGWFHEGLLEADMLLPSGEVVTISPKGEYAELFSTVPNSLGSFGYLLRLRMRVQKATEWVRLEKVWHSTPEELVAGLAKASEATAGNDFVDGVALSDIGGMVMTARFVSSIPDGEVVVRYGVWPRFYPTILHEGYEYQSTMGYLWRWDADWFWVTQIFPGLSFRIVRWLCGSTSLRSDCYKVFNDFVIKTVVGPLGLDKNEELIIQDIDIPVEKSAEWIRQFVHLVPSDRIGKIKLSLPLSSKQTVPLWLCPIKSAGSPLVPVEAGKLYINFGFWDALTGPETKGGMKAGRINRALEQMCTTLGGMKTLYSSTFFSEEQLFTLYNGEAYKKVKAQYDPEGRVRGWYDRLSKA